MPQQLYVLSPTTPFCLLMHPCFLLSPFHSLSSVTKANICATTGSNVIVAGTSIFMAKDPSEVISALRAAVDSAIKARKV